MRQPPAASSSCPICRNVWSEIKYASWDGQLSCFHRHIILLNYTSVEKYDISSATLSVRHNHPDSVTVARVNVDHILESAQRSDLEVGAWVNVTGYVNQIKERRLPERVDGRARRRTKVQVQAIMLWSAGSLNVQKYEEALEARKKAALA